MKRRPSMTDEEWEKASCDHEMGPWEPFELRNIRGEQRRCLKCGLLEGRTRGVLT